MTQRKSPCPRPVPVDQAAQPAVSQIRHIKIRDRHLDLLAALYVRQSTPQQVKDNRESRERQYALADYAVHLGWPRERVLIIDEDQGRSGRAATSRSGFQRLLDEVTMGHVGLVLALEASRLSRSSADWHHLLEVCAVFGTLLADQDGVYDPTDPNDRLLLGLKGTLSEAEQFTLRNRLERGRQNKAMRGELFNGLSCGYVFLASGEVALDPDEQVRAVVRLIFDKFDELGSGWAVFRYLRRHHIDIGQRRQRGPRRGDLVWKPASLPTVYRILKHPIYSGTYSYGRQHIVPGKTSPSGRPSCRLGSLEETKVLLRDWLPAYITWERYQANLERLQQNRSQPNSPGVARAGAALLGGLIVCGTCRYRLVTRYRGQEGRPFYYCEQHLKRDQQPTCLSVRASVVDDVVAAQVLCALEPAALELSLQAAADTAQERARLDQHWQQKRTRARYEADRAEQQYQAIDPANRLVARTLEQRWEEALCQLRQIEEDYDRFAHVQPPQLSTADRERIKELARDIPALWAAAATTAVERKEIIRCLVERVVVVGAYQSPEVNVTIHWRGGHVTRQTVERPLANYEQLKEYPQLIAQVRQWHGKGYSPQQIAERLNAAGYRTPRRQRPYTREQVHELLRRAGLSGGRMLPEALVAGEWWLCDLAVRLDVSAATLRRWVARGWVRARQARGQHHWIVWADRNEQKRLRALAALVRVGANDYPPALTTPKQS